MNVEIHGELREAALEHFTYVATIDQDLAAGDALAELIGDTYTDCMHQSPVEQWTQIAKALRVHGFTIKVTVVREE